jgi:hypothetical protein
MKKETKTPKKEAARTCVNINCPHHRIISDRDPHDWFCDDDVAVICLLKKQKENPKSIYQVDRQPFRAVTCACRPYMARKESLIPKWCPLKGKKKT